MRKLFERKKLFPISYRQKLFVKLNHEKILLIILFVNVSSHFDFRSVHYEKLKSREVEKNQHGIFDAFKIQPCMYFLLSYLPLKFSHLFLEGLSNFKIQFFFRIRQLR